MKTRARHPIAPRLLLAVCIGLVLPGVPSAFAKPAKVILLRHAEKPEDENNAHLSPEGKARAEALVGFFSNRFEISITNPPAALFATRPIRGSRSLRPRQTLEPLAESLKLPIHQPETAFRYDRLAAHVLTNAAYDNKTVVICWVHDEMDDLARTLGAEPKKDWKGSVYDRVWVLTFKKKEVRCKTVLQKLMPGDDMGDEDD
jgi:hypothetical protein